MGIYFLLLKQFCFMAVMKMSSTALLLYFLVVVSVMGLHEDSEEFGAEDLMQMEKLMQLEKMTKLTESENLADALSYNQIDIGLRRNPNCKYCKYCSFCHHCGSSWCWWHPQCAFCWACKYCKDCKYC